MINIDFLALFLSYFRRHFRIKSRGGYFGWTDRYGNHAPEFDSDIADGDHQ